MDSQAQKLPRSARVSGAIGWPSPDFTAWLRKRVALAGGDPNIVPDEPFRFIRRPEIETRSGLSRSSIYRGIEAGTFPAPVPLCSSGKAA